MIDAYEIGIQLALQDGVSAGLRVIAQGLETLDRAVAATAGRLEALTGTAQAAQRAVAAVGSGRAPAVTEPAAPEREPGAAGSPVAGARAAMPPAVAVATRQAEVERPVAAPVARPGQPTPLPTAAMAVPTGTPPDLRAAPAAARAVPMLDGPAAVAPTRAAAPEMRQTADRGPAAPGPVAAGAARAAPGAVPAAPVTPAMPEAMRVAAPSVRAAAPVAEGSRAVPAAPITPGAMIRSGARGSGRAPEGLVAPRVRAMAAAPRTPAAPVAASGMAAGGMAAAPGGELFAGKPSAPPPQAQDGGRSGGDVMLDGRLVGHWLADRMGRDAGRPPAGTTHFDPRQAPAWTPSGAL